MSELLEIAPEVDLRVRPGGLVEISCRGIRRECGAHALAVLHAFRAPRELGEALEELGRLAVGDADGLALNATVKSLVAAGALRDPAGSAAAEATHLGNFERQSEHILMLDDEVRTGTFVNAVREAVRPDDVVLDIGTGSGLLAIAAAQAGARHVYAIEAGAMVEAARRMVAANGLSHKITVIHGFSTNVTLPERATLLVTEILGCDPFEEDALLVNRDARRRLLTEGARMLPSTLRLYAWPVEIPTETWQTEIFDAELAARWSERYGIDFSALPRFERPARFTMNRPRLATWRNLAEPVLLGEMDFRTSEQTVSFEATVVAREGAARYGIATYFEVPLSSQTSFSQDPRLPSVTGDWPCPIWVQPPGGPLSKGDTLRLSYRHEGKSSLHWDLA